MKYEHSITDIIKNRTSQRTYDGLPLDVAKKTAIQTVLQNPASGPFGGKVRLSLLEQDTPVNKPQKLGTYGIIKGTNSFLVGAVKKSDRALEDFGFVFESIILKATDLDLGTCWLGGSFKRSAFAAAINMQPDEIIPAVSPIGNTKKKRSLRDRTIRLLASSKERKSWSELFYEEEFSNPLPEDSAGSYATVLEMVRLAPSASNKQPWRILHADGCYHLFLKRTKGYGGMLAVDIQRVDMGIAMCHFELTARELNISGQWDSLISVSQMQNGGVEYIASWRED
jgi:hypothetical protein